MSCPGPQSGWCRDCWLGEDLLEGRGTILPPYIAARQPCRPALCLFRLLYFWQMLARQGSSAYCSCAAVSQVARLAEAIGRRSRPASASFRQAQHAQHALADHTRCAARAQISGRCVACAAAGSKPLPTSYFLPSCGLLGSTLQSSICFCCRTQPSQRHTAVTRCRLSCTAFLYFCRHRQLGTTAPVE